MTLGFKIIGISVRTTNQNNKAATDLDELWQRFYSENIFEQIPNKTSSEILSIYTDYESDYTGTYTTLIGVRVSTLIEIPDGLIGREFGEENFELFTAKGEMPAAVLTSWKEIWAKDKELNRAYDYDFEVYGADSQKGKDSEVEIFVSVKG